MKRIFVSRPVTKGAGIEHVSVYGCGDRPATLEECRRILDAEVTP